MKVTDSLRVGEKNHGIEYISGESDSVFLYARNQKPLTKDYNIIFIPQKNALLKIDKVYNKMESIIISADKSSAMFFINIDKKEQDVKSLDSWHYYKWLECPCDDEEIDKITLKSKSDL